MSRCMRKSALKAREKINNIIEWETCDETSEMFQKAAAALDEEIGSELLTVEESKEKEMEDEWQLSSDGSNHSESCPDNDEMSDWLEIDSGDDEVDDDWKPSKKKRGDQTDTHDEKALLNASRPEAHAEVGGNEEREQQHEEGEGGVTPIRDESIEQVFAGETLHSENVFDEGVGFLKLEGDDATPYGFVDHDVYCSVGNNSMFAEF